MSDLISIIIRTKNEEHWIGLCLKKIKIQSFKNYEVIIVDNKSIDSTIEKAKSIIPDVITCNIDEFKPGKALNLGIEKSNGEYIVCLSAHCIPADENWLVNLYNEIKSDEMVAGVYGRQLPTDQTHDIDKRDMYLVFGLDKKVQHKDPFFHNANSIIKKSIWREFPFDNEEINIEDRIWGQMIIEQGYKLVYNPTSMVYHMHGVHQTNKNRRYKNITRVIEETTLKINSIPINDYSFCAIIPILRVELENELNCQIFIDTLLMVRSISYFSNIILTTDNAFALNKVLKINNIDVNSIIIHERNYENKRLLDVYNETIKFLKEKNIFPDIVLTTDISYPIKSKQILESCIYELLKNDVDAVIPAFTEKRPAWIKNNDEYERIDNYETKKENRIPVYVGLENICLVVYTNKIFSYNTFFNNKIEMVLLDNPFNRFKIEELVSINDYNFIKKKSHKYEKRNK